MVEQEDPVGVRISLLEVVGREHDGRALPGDRADPVPELRASLDVQRCCRLVDGQQLRPAGHRDGEPHALGLAAAGGCQQQRRPR